ncbi:hypothetical protein ACLOJK_009400 [Asimina triloba]
MAESQKAESQKETSSAIHSKKRSSAPPSSCRLGTEEEIGGDFLSSWKSKTVDEDPFDLNCETVPKSRKNTFNFGKMDMDFALGGDFDKISSFKMDMSDLDFSSPPRKPEKLKENSRKESLLGIKEGKQDPFNFSFDFNEYRLDGFDLDSSLLKAEEKSAKTPVCKAVDSAIKPTTNQPSTSNSSTSMDPFGMGIIKKLQTIDSGTTAKLDNLVRGQADIDASNDGAPHPENSGNQDASPVISSSMEKQTGMFMQHVGREHNEARCHREQSHMASFVEPHAQHAMQDTSAQSVSGDDSMHGTVPKLQMGSGSLNAEAHTNPCGDPAVSSKSVSSSQSQNSSSVKSYNSKVSTPIETIKMQKFDKEFEKDSESQEDVSRENAAVKESTHGHAKTVTDDATIETISKKQHGSKAIGEKSTLNVLISSFHRESGINKFVPSKEQETNAISSKYFRKPENVRSQFSPPPAKKKISAIFDRKIDGLLIGPIDNKRHELRNNQGQATIQKSNTLKSLNGVVMKGLSVIVGSKTNVKDSDISRSQVRPTRLAAHLIPSGTPKIGNRKLVLSSITPVKNSNASSDKKMFEIANLRISSEPLKSMDQQETNSVKLSERIMATDVNMTCKMLHSVNSDKLTLLSPSLKRKFFEGTNADPSALSPSKRATESPTESRNELNYPQRTDDKRATSTPDCPKEMTMTDLEIPLLMESDGNVEKAEACAKELDYICNTLKKKHDEAKELLVRAMVNNNQLLMLNHPIFEEKISFSVSFSMNFFRANFVFLDFERKETRSIMKCQKCLYKSPISGDAN